MAELRNRRIAGYEYGGELGLDEMQPRPPAPLPKWRRAVENTVWLAAAAFAMYYGDGHSDFFSVLISNPRIMRRPFYVGLLCLAINTVIFLYLAVWLRHVIKTDASWDVIAPGAIPTATILGVGSFLMFVFALWPVWGFLTLPLLVTLFMSLVIISPYLPPYTKNIVDEQSSDPKNLYKNHD